MNHSNASIAALIVAAGIGRRAGGDIPKQYTPLHGVPMLVHSIRALLAHPRIRHVQVVIHPEHAAHYAAALRALGSDAPSRLLPVVNGGAERTDSVQAGLLALAPHAPDYVLIHDAARPFLSSVVIDRILAALTPETGVVPVLAVADTTRRCVDGTWSDIPRDGLLRIQTPQAFPFRVPGSGFQVSGSGKDALTLTDLFTHLASLEPGTRNLEPPSPTDDAAIWLAAGHKLAYVAGDEELRKVTTMDDVRWAEKNACLTRRVRTAIGSGYDVHALIPGDGTLRLGGIDIPHTHRLDGHSDADVVLHAVVDALLGCIAAGDIGSFFPPSDPRWRGANSAIFIEEARAQVAARGGVIEHLDITVIGERPKIAPHREAMQEAIARLLHLPRASVSVKATTTEKLGFTGREEGLAAHAIATVSLPREES